MPSRLTRVDPRAALEAALERERRHAYGPPWALTREQHQAILRERAELDPESLGVGEWPFTLDEALGGDADGRAEYLRSYRRSHRVRAEHAPAGFSAESAPGTDGVEQLRTRHVAI